MIRSMTGFGKAEISVPDKKFTLEIKCLNSKNADINLKVPNVFKEKELEMRQIINDRLQRGKIDVNIYYELREGITPASVNQETVKAYYNQLKQVSNDLDLQEDINLLDVIMRLPDTLKIEKNTSDEYEWETIKKNLLSAIDDLDSFRIQEGKSLEYDLNLRIKNISDRLNSLNSFENVRIDKLREKLLAQILELNKNIEVDKNRFEQELIYYLEKLDFSEEKSRLANHLNYFIETMNNEENPGKKLAFISQEIGREINTLGSKAGDFNIQKLVVEMKDELEKIKEQLLNVL